MVRVRTLKPSVLRGKPVAADVELELEDRLAAAWVAEGYAELAGEPAAAPPPPPPAPLETAATPPPSGKPRGKAKG